MSQAADHLRTILNFNDLIHYLEEKLDWPLRQYGFDELTFEYQPEELGLKEEDAAKVRAIHQLRPLHHDQPWGIFFVEFENKKLPVVVLRRILSHLVIKKRASANRAGEAAWHSEDLMFITTFGEEGNAQREIAFAHFHQSAGDLPTLHVLGWDGGDTPLKLAHLNSDLQQHLRWPDNPADHRAWRQQWACPFRHRIGHIIRTADALAEALAALARSINEKVTRMLAVESENGPLRMLYKAFQTSLIHDLTEDNFADTYAQTITYGLLTAAISRTDWSEGRHGTFIIAENVTDMVPITNPFLKEMLQTFLKVGGRKGGIDFDELGIQDVVELLRGEETDLPAILRDFGNKTKGEDPVIHFYEHFLSAYNKKLKIQRGVFYTPQPVVSYIIRSVHELLQTEFGLEDGLASTMTWGEMIARHPEMKLPVLTPRNPAKPDSKDVLISTDTPFVMILDIATGTGTFLVETIEVIFKTMKAKWQKQNKSESEIGKLWNEYVSERLLPRLYGYELMMAPYAIAHMKIGLKLFETGYQFKSNERVRVYLTNTLEPPSDVQQKLEGISPALAHEAEAVNDVKRDIKFTIIVGNPPYAKLSQNQGHWVNTLMARYKTTVKSEEIQIQALSNDYVKFICLASYFLESSEKYILGMITDNSYLDGPLFRDMRADLIKFFQIIHITDLGGNSRKVDATLSDQNIFDIQQGVSIIIGSRNATTDCCVKYASIMGTRDEKSYLLRNKTSNTINHATLLPIASQYYFLPSRVDNIREWDSWLSLPQIFAGGIRNGRPLPFNGAALATRHDLLAIAFTNNELRRNLEIFFDLSETRDSLDKRFSLCSTSHFDFNRARTDVTLKEAEASIRPILYRPFDIRQVVYHPLMIGEPRPEVMRHLLHGGLALLSTRRVTGKPYDNVFVCRGLVEYKAATHDRNTQVFPLYLDIKAENDTIDIFFAERNKMRPNIAPEIYSMWKGRMGNLSPDDMFFFIYAILYSPEYRRRYKEYLQQDYARIALPSDPKLTQKLVVLGSDLVALHLLECPKMDHFIAKLIGEGDNSIPKKPTWTDNAVWINPTQRFEGVPENVWNFHIGGYQVCEKWLKDRKGRTLSDEDIKHYQRIVVALNETIRIMAEIDEVIDEHGGWPGAFI